MVTQLELELWDQLQLAQQMPEAIDLTQMLDEVEAAAAQLPEAQRLRFAGDALLQIAELCAVRSEVLITQWEEGYRDPLVERGFFADVVRQTMAVDLSDLIEPTPPRKPRTQPAKSTEAEAGSIAAPVDKAAVLAMLEQWEADDEETQKQVVLAIAHSEDVSAWSAAIAQWLQTAPNCSASIAALSHGLEMSWVEVWLGVLFGRFQLQQWGEFYASPIWVTCLSEQAVLSEGHVG